MIPAETQLKNEFFLIPDNLSLKIEINISFNTFVPIQLNF